MDSRNTKELLENEKFVSIHEKMYTSWMLEYIRRAADFYFSL